MTDQTDEPRSGSIGCSGTLRKCGQNKEQYSNGELPRVGISRKPPVRSD